MYQFVQQSCYHTSQAHLLRSNLLGTFSYSLLCPVTSIATVTGTPGRIVSGLIIRRQVYGKCKRIRDSQYRPWQYCMDIPRRDMDTGSTRFFNSGWENTDKAGRGLRTIEAICSQHAYTMRWIVNTCPCSCLKSTPVLIIRLHQATGSSLMAIDALKSLMQND